MNSTNETPAETPPPEIPGSPLTDYYEGKVPARQCLDRMRREGRFSTPDAVQRELLERLDTLDPGLDKTWALVKGELRRPSPAGILVEWLHRVSTKENRADAIPVSVRSALASLTETCLPAKGKVTRRSQNVWRLGVLDLRWQRDITVEQLALVLAEHFVRAAERSDVVEKRVLTTLLHGSKAQLAGAALYVTWMLRLSSGQAAELATTRSDLETAREQRTRLRADLTAAGETITTLSGQLADSAKREAELLREMQEAHDAATLRLHELAGKATGKLTARIGPLLNQAEDALTMSEPSIRAAREFIETAKNESEGLVQWLRAESTSEPPTA
ncbi:MAG: hypothetical protein R2712_12295 [Vicinamibacterales bacterium]